MAAKAFDRQKYGKPEEKAGGSRYETENRHHARNDYQPRQSHNPRSENSPREKNGRYLGDRLGLQPGADSVSD